MRIPYILVYAALILTVTLEVSAQDKSAKASESARASSTVVKSKSNITNNREAAPSDTTDPAKEK